MPRWKQSKKAVTARTPDGQMLSQFGARASDFRALDEQINQT